MFRYLIVFFSIILLFLGGCVEKEKLPPPKTMNYVNLTKYQGVWYEIARLPNYFEKGCLKPQANYTLKDNYIEVLNQCRLKNGKIKQVKGKAWPIDKTNSKLKVQFFWPFRGDYWILYINPGYKYALVGVPSRQYLWILARKPMIIKDNYDKLVKIAEQQGFKVDKLLKN